MNNYSNSENLTINEVLETLIKWKIYFKSKLIAILVWVVIGSALGFVVSKLIKPRFIGELTFALDEKDASGSLGAYAGIASQFGFDLGGGGGAFAGENILELMKSRLIIEKTLLTQVDYNSQKTLLVDLYINFNELRDDWKNNKDLINIDFAKTNREDFTIKHDSLLKEFYYDIKNNYLQLAKVDKKLNLVSVKVTSRNEYFSKLFVEQLVKNVSVFYIETKTKKSRKNVEILQFRTDSVKNELDKNMYGAAVSQDQNINIIRAQAKVPSVRKQMNVQMLSTMYSELVKNLELSKISLMREEPLIQTIDVPILPLEKVKIGAVKGIALGGALAGFISVVFFVLKKLLKDFQNKEQL